MNEYIERTPVAQNEYNRTTYHVSDGQRGFAPEMVIGKNGYSDERNTMTELPRHKFTDAEAATDAEEVTEEAPKGLTRDGVEVLETLVNVALRDINNTAKLIVTGMRADVDGVLTVDEDGNDLKKFWDAKIDTLRSNLSQSCLSLVKALYEPEESIAILLSQDTTAEIVTPNINLGEE